MAVSESEMNSASVVRLMEFLDSPDRHDRARAARLLVNGKEQPELVWPRLLLARHDDYWMVRYQLPRATVHFQIPAAQAIPVLRELLDDPYESVQSGSAWALERFGQGLQSDTLAELVRQGKRQPRTG